MASAPTPSGRLMSFIKIRWRHHKTHFPWGHSWHFPEVFSQICVLDTRRLTIKSWISIMAHQYKPVTSWGLQLEKSETSEEFLLVETGDFTKVVFFFGWFHLGVFRNVTNVEFQGSPEPSRHLHGPMRAALWSGKTFLDTFLEDYLARAVSFGPEISVQLMAMKSLDDPWNIHHGTSTVLISPT